MEKNDENDPLNCNSEKVLHLLKCKVCGEASYVGKAKTKFRYRLNNYKSKHRAFRKGNRKIPQKCFQGHYCLEDHLGIMIGILLLSFIHTNIYIYIYKKI